MSRSSIVLGLISSFAAIILAFTSYYAYVYIPILLSLIFGLTAFYMGRKHNYPTKPVQFILIVVLISISIAIFRAVYSYPENATTETIST